MYRFFYPLHISYAHMCTRDLVHILFMPGTVLLIVKFQIYVRASSSRYGCVKAKLNDYGR